MIAVRGLDETFGDFSELNIAVAHFKDGDTCHSSSYFRGNAEFRDGKCLISSPLNI